MKTWDEVFAEYDRRLRLTDEPTMRDKARAERAGRAWLASEEARRAYERRKCIERNQLDLFRRGGGS